MDGKRTKAFLRATTLAFAWLLLGTAGFSAPRENDASRSETASQPAPTPSGDPVPDGPRPRPAAPDSIPGHKFYPLPVFFYQPETGVGGGFGLLHTFRTALDSRTSSNSLLCIYTEKKQYSMTLTPELYTSANRWRLAGSLIGSRFPDFFYGIGNGTRAEDKASFTLNQFRAGFEARRLIAPALYAGGTLYYQKATVHDPSRNLDAFGASIPARGGTEQVCAGAVLVLDDRDYPFCPTHGRLVTLSVSRFAKFLGSDLTSTREELDARQYVPLGRGQTLALQVLLDGTTGARPFFDMANLGGANILRGVYEGRFRDRQRLVGQVEYRFPLLGPAGGAIFGGAGEVADRAGGFRARAVHAAGGAGFRWLLSCKESVRLRIDFGWAAGASGLYFAIGEAF